MLHAKLLWSCLTLGDPEDCSLPVPAVSMGFPRQEYKTGLPCPPPGDLPDPGIEAIACGSYTADGFFTVESPGNSRTLK